MSDTFLDKAYNLSTPEDTRDLYDAWAESYDKEIGDNGYATPRRVAEALFQFAQDPDEPVLDFGCGTGLSGLALKLAGFTVIDGMDPSHEMLNGAKSKQVYRDVSAFELTDTSPIEHEKYTLITCIGVIGTGAAPASTFDLVLRALSPNGLLGLSLNDHALAEAQYEAAMNQWLDCGAARLLFKEYGPHLPGQNISSNVYVIQKT